MYDIHPLSGHFPSVTAAQYKKLKEGHSRQRSDVPNRALRRHGVGRPFPPADMRRARVDFVLCSRFDFAGDFLVQKFVTFATRAADFRSPLHRHAKVLFIRAVRSTNSAAG